MKKNLLIFLAAAVIIAFYSSAGMGTDFINYENSNYNYRVIIPGAWKKVINNQQSKHVLLITNSFNTSVKIEVLKSGGDIEKIIHEKKWELRQIDSSVRSIIETPTVTLKDKASGKLLVFEYFLNSSMFLNRTFVSKNEDMIYIIECKSPVWYFYKVEYIFNTVLASFEYLSVEKAEAAVEEKAEPKPAKKESIAIKPDKEKSEDLEDEDSGSDESADDESSDEDEE